MWRWGQFLRLAKTTPPRPIAMRMTAVSIPDFVGGTVIGGDTVSQEYPHPPGQPSFCRQTYFPDGQTGGVQTGW